MLKIRTLVVLALAALSVHAQSLDFLVTGEYGWYSDERGPDAYLRGYWYLGMREAAHVFVVRSVGPRASGERRFVASVVDRGADGLELGDVQGDLKPDEHGHFQAIIDLLNFLSLRKGRADAIGWMTEVEDRWEESDPPYSLYFEFGRAVPLFGFLGIRHESKSELSYRLVAAGLIDYEEQSGFLETLPRAPAETALPEAPPALDKARSGRVDLGAFSVALDKRWKRNDEVVTGGYWLALRTIRDSQVSVESMPVDGADPEVATAWFLKAMLLIQDDWIDFDTVRFMERDGLVTLAFSLSDERGVRNVQAFVVKSEQDFLHTLNVSAFEDIWLANEAYFEGILESAR